jgi:hypothetical protein
VATPTLRPLGIGEVLDVAIKIYMSNAVALWKLVLAVVAPVALLSVVVEASATPSTSLDEFGIDPETGEFVTTTDDELWTYLAGAGVSLLLLLLATILASGACFKVVADAYLGRPVEWRSSLAFVARRLHSVVWVTVLTFVLSGLGLILCVVPGVYLWFAFAVAVPVLLTEQLKGRKALGRSRRLVKGRWWHVFAALVLGTILTSIVSGVITGLATVAVDDQPATVGWIAVSWLAQTISSVLTTPFTAAVAIVVYFDLRVRKEAFDLELLAAQLGVEPPPGAAPAIGPLIERPQPTEQPPFWPPPPGWTPRGTEPDGDPDDR